jgi:hypothetical protein
MKRVDSGLGSETDEAKRVEEESDKEEKEEAKSTATKPRREGLRERK